MPPCVELVVLVNERNEMLGTMPKSEVHQRETPLHRAFSSFVFRRGKRAGSPELLLQQRSSAKKTWPLLWSNTCCGHPGLEETTVDAARRRLRFELGLEVRDLEEVAPYRYCFSRDGVMENEICPIVIGITDCEPRPRPDEVEATRWTDWLTFVRETEEHPERYSEWCVEEVAILKHLPRLQKLFEMLVRPRS
jgi:isopentenyl-diphosphate delta-isomerase